VVLRKSEGVAFFEPVIGDLGKDDGDNMTDVSVAV
jgi:hypothetical protein